MRWARRAGGFGPDRVGDRDAVTDAYHLASGDHVRPDHAFGDPGPHDIQPYDGRPLDIQPYDGRPLDIQPPDGRPLDIQPYDIFSGGVDLDADTASDRDADPDTDSGTADDPGDR